jgi:hypothetical protein
MRYEESRKFQLALKSLGSWFFDLLSWFLALDSLFLFLGSNIQLPLMPTDPKNDNVYFNGKHFDYLCFDKNNK